MIHLTQFAVEFQTPLLYYRVHIFGFRDITGHYNKITIATVHTVFIVYRFVLNSYSYIYASGYTMRP